MGGPGTTRTTREAMSVRQNVGSGGVGFRCDLARKFGLHAGIDVEQPYIAWSTSATQSFSNV
jgi:hypothetical protein